MAITQSTLLTVEGRWEKHVRYVGGHPAQAGCQQLGERESGQPRSGGETALCAGLQSADAGPRWEPALPGMRRGCSKSEWRYLCVFSPKVLWLGLLMEAIRYRKNPEE